MRYGRLVVIFPVTAGLQKRAQDFNAMNAQDGKAEAWLISFTKQLRYDRSRAPASESIADHLVIERGYLKDNTSLRMLVCTTILFRIATHVRLAVAPWFSASKYKTGAYAAINAAVGNIIDWVCLSHQLLTRGADESWPV
jgi:hypothetical protein